MHFSLVEAKIRKKTQKPWETHLKKIENVKQNFEKMFKHFKPAKKLSTTQVACPKTLQT